MKRLAALAALLCASLAAEDPAARLSQKQLDRWVSHWQHILTLDDYRITVQAAPLEEFKPGTIGESRTQTAMKRLDIRVLRPEDYRKVADGSPSVPTEDAAVRRDIEDTIVHELVHLRLRELVQAAPNDIPAAEELAVDRITKALLAASKK